MDHQLLYSRIIHFISITFKEQIIINTSTPNLKEEANIAEAGVKVGIKVEVLKKDQDLNQKIDIKAVEEGEALPHIVHIQVQAQNQDHQLRPIRQSHREKKGIKINKDRVNQ